MDVWVLDICGYDARGGVATVFSTVDKAKAAVPRVEWIETKNGWDERVSPSSTADMWTIYKVTVDEP